jgi:hypothetical protein
VEAAGSLFQKAVYEFSTSAPCFPSVDWQVAARRVFIIDSGSGAFPPTHAMRVRPR